MEAPMLSFITAVPNRLVIPRSEEEQIHISVSDNIPEQNTIAEVVCSEIPAEICQVSMLVDNIDSASVDGQIICSICGSSITKVALMSIQNLESSTSKAAISDRLSEYIGDTFLKSYSDSDLICKNCTHLVEVLDDLHRQILEGKELLCLRYNKTLLKRKAEQEKILSEVDIKKENNEEVELQIKKERHKEVTENVFGNRRKGRPPRKQKLCADLKPEPSPADNVSESVDIEVGNDAESDEELFPTNKSGRPQRACRLKKQYSCTKCAFASEDKEELHQHKKLSHIERPWVCDICNKTFSVKHNWLIHQSSHTGERPFVCEMCGKSFRHNQSLRNHHRTCHSKETPYNCKQCNEAFPSLHKLKTHIRRHFPGKNYICETCGAAYTNAQSLQNHMSVHTGIYRLTCENCGKGFHSQSVLQEHLNTHTGEMPYSCSVCSRKFKNRGSLWAHKQTHDNPYPYTCTQCCREFIHSSNLREHLKIHTGEKPHHCHVCTRRFHSKTHLRRHLLTHTGIRPYSCNKCGLSYTRKEKLKNHISRKHETAKNSCGDEVKKDMKSADTNNAGKVATLNKSEQPVEIVSEAILIDKNNSENVVHNEMYISNNEQVIIPPVIALL